MQDVLMRYAAAMSLADAPTQQDSGAYAPGLDPGDLGDNVLDSAAFTRAVPRIDNFQALFAIGLFEQKLLLTGEKQAYVMPCCPDICQSHTP
jgi:hypothetical protein